MMKLSGKDWRSQDEAKERFQELIAAARFPRHRAPVEASSLDSELDRAATELRAIDRNSKGELFAQLGRSFFEASDIFYSTPFFATALMRAGFSPMVFEPTGQGACFKRPCDGSSFELHAPEIYRRAFDSGWDPENPLDESGLQCPARKAFLRWVGQGSELSATGREIFELCAPFCPSFDLKRARQDIKDHGYHFGDHGARAKQALAYFSSMIESRALRSAIGNPDKGPKRSPSI